MTPLRRVALWGWSLVLWMTMGCASFGTYQSAWTLEKGRLEFDARPQFSAGQPQGGAVGLLPGFSAGVKYGAGETTEIGGRIGSDGLHGDLKFQLSRSETSAVALAPSLGFTHRRRGRFSVIELAIPAPIGLRWEWGELVVAPKVVGRLIASPFGVGEALSAGGSIGLVKPLGAVTIHPEVSVGYPFYLSAPDVIGGELVMGGRGIMINVGCGIRFGRPE